VTSDFYCDEVLSGRTAVEVVHEDDVVLAFHHTRPAYRDAHVVVIPKRHTADLRSVDGATLARLLEVVQRLAGRIVDEHGACRVVTNLGRYQDSKHLHWHLVSGERLPSASA
jgi:histidine triad (HIT) family protein